MTQFSPYETSLFLTQLSNKLGAAYTFVPLRSGDPGRALLNVTLADAMPTLKSLSKTGSDIYVTVNVNDAEGRRAENITQVRCIFADYDAGVPGAWLLPPSMLVESSPGKAQAYWMLKYDVAPSAQWAAVERAVVWATAADKNVCDVARVLRVPGFVNHKYPDKPLCKIIYTSEKRYTLDDIEAVYGAIAPPAQMAAGLIVAPDDEGKMRRYKLWLEAAGTPPRSSSGRLAIARNWLFRKCAAGVWDFDLSVPTVAELVSAHIEELDYTDAYEFARDAEKYGHGIKGSAYVRVKTGDVAMEA